jgi:antitoxin VapB
MARTRVFRSGNSQAVRLPKEFQFDADEVEIFRRGDEIILRRTPSTLDRAFALLTSLSDDFMADGRKQPALRRRRGL